MNNELCLICSGTVSCPACHGQGTREEYNRVRVARDALEVQ